MKTTIKVTGMACMHCAGSVTKVLEGIPGVEKAVVSLKEEKVTVTGDADTASLLMAIREEGYEAQLL